MEQEVYFRAEKEKPAEETVELPVIKTDRWGNPIEPTISPEDNSDNPVN